MRSLEKALQMCDLHILVRIFAFIISRIRWYRFFLFLPGKYCVKVLIMWVFSCAVRQSDTIRVVLTYLSQVENQYAKWVLFIWWLKRLSWRCIVKKGTTFVESHFVLIGFLIRTFRKAFFGFDGKNCISNVLQKMLFLKKIIGGPSFQY